MTVKELRDALGVSAAVCSGDHPDTVRSLAVNVGVVPEAAT